MKFDNLSIEEAVFLASLPHRQGFYKNGGWLATSGPGSRDWEIFLKENFTQIDRLYAKNEADQYKSLSKNKRNFKIISIWENEYPENLKNIFDPPPVLFIKGDLVSFSENTVSIVGTRKPAPIALAATEEFVFQYSEKFKEGCIVSGFAYGIDGFTHRKAIQFGIPGAAILGSGILYAGPSVNLDIPYLADKFNVSFSLISEFAPHKKGHPSHFPRRNRIIAGISKATVVMQAPYKSGALITAHFAMDEGREVMAFDHTLLRNTGLNEGARKLIREGATKLYLPFFRRKILKRPDLHAQNSEKKLFWEKKQNGSLLWLGGQYYYEREPFDF